MSDLSRFQNATEVQIVAEDGREFIETVSKTFWCCVDRIVSGGTETPQLLLRNPSGSGKNLFLDLTSFCVTSNISSLVVIKCYLSPTIGGTGASQSVFSGLIGGGAGSGQVFSGPTVTANGSKILTGMLTGGPSGNSLMHDLKNSVQIPAGNDLLITAFADGTNRALSISLRWREI